MRLGLICLALLLVIQTARADDSGTFTVQDGSAPWSDRVGTWELGDVPASLKRTDALPQQSCSDRAIVLTTDAKSITIGVCDADVDKMKAAYPDAKLTDDKFTIRHPKEATGLPYSVMTLANPPKNITAAELGAGLVVLKIESNSTASPAAKP
jgi:hypothetical protein